MILKFEKIKLIEECRIEIYNVIESSYRVSVLSFII